MNQPLKRDRNCPVALTPTHQRLLQLIDSETPLNEILKELDVDLKKLGVTLGRIRRYYAKQPLEKQRDIPTVTHLRYLDRSLWGRGWELGTLCGRDHDWKQTGMSIRNSQGGCVICAAKAIKKRAAIRELNKRRAANRV